MNFAKRIARKLLGVFAGATEPGNPSVRVHEDRISGRGKTGIRHGASLAIRESRA